MNKRLKFGATAVCASLIVLSLMVIYPAPPGVRIHGIVSAAPTWDNYTRIYEVSLRQVVDSEPYLTTFTENNTTNDVDVGDKFAIVEVKVYLKKEYADDVTEAANYTRIMMKIENPAESTVWENYLIDAVAVTDLGTSWRLVYKHYVINDLGDNITLTEGTWTLTTTYDVYA